MYLCQRRRGATVKVKRVDEPDKGVLIYGEKIRVHTYVLLKVFLLGKNLNLKNEEIV
jgi:hypothetical protein